MQDGVATIKATNMLCMGMVFFVATSLLVVANWIGGGVDGASMRVEALQPLAMFAVGVGVRYLGSMITHNAVRFLHVLIGDVVAVLIGLLAFFIVAAAHDQTKSVVLAAIVLTIVIVPASAIASLIASSIARSRPAVVGMSIVSLCMMFGAVAAQGSIYWA